MLNVYLISGKELRFSCNGALYAANRCDSIDEVLKLDQRAAVLMDELRRDLEEAEKKITEYRLTLAKRAEELEAQQRRPFKTVVVFYRRSYGSVYYEIFTGRTFLDQKSKDILAERRENTYSYPSQYFNVEDERQTFTGKERHKAIAAWKQLLKDHPGIEAHDLTGIVK